MMRWGLVAVVLAIMSLADANDSCNPATMAKHDVDCVVTSANSPLVSLISITPADIKLILKVHNQIRSAVQPPAANMVQMYWDNSLARVAAGWAMNCSDGHDNSTDRRIPSLFSVGQNLYLSTQQDSWGDAINSWGDEKKDWAYGSTTPTGMVGHYTQIIWANTYLVGCALAQCRTDFGFHFYCNYGPAGNIVGEGYPDQPYEKLIHNPACPASRRSQKLCDCKGKVCIMPDPFTTGYNTNGDLNLKNCHCKTGKLV